MHMYLNHEVSTDLLLRIFAFETTRKGFKKKIPLGTPLLRRFSLLVCASNRVKLLGKQPILGGEYRTPILAHTQFPLFQLSALLILHFLSLNPRDLTDCPTLSYTCFTYFLQSYYISTFFQP